jgi:cytoskeletal protein RodZ
MKELGQYLKETRINNSVSIDEAAQDLDIDSFLLESIEEGNIKAFKDVLSMKEKVKDYAKYLGLKPDEVIDEFNDYLFEKTSKISLKDIMDAEKDINKNKQENKKISSPYTIIKPKKKNKKPIIIGLILFILVLMIISLVFGILRPKRDKTTIELRSVMEGENYEFA